MTVIGEAFIAIKPDAAAFGAETQQAAGAAGAAAGQTFSSEFSSSMRPDTSAFTDQVTADAGGAGEGAGDTFSSEFSENLEVDASAVGESLAADVGDAGEAAATGFSEGFSDNVAVDAADLGAELTDTIGAAGDDAGGAFSAGFGDAVAVDVSDLAEDLTDTVADAGESGGEAFSDAFADHLALDAGDTADGLAGEFGDAGDAAADTFTESFADSFEPPDAGELGGDSLAAGFGDAGSNAGEVFATGFGVAAGEAAADPPDPGAFGDAGADAGASFGQNFNRTLLDVGIAAAAVGIIRAGIGEFDEAQRGLAQTQAVIKSTGGAANVAAEDVERLTTKLSQQAAVDDDVIRKGVNLLLTYTNVKNEVGATGDVFDRATELLVDFATAKGVDVTAAATLLGKALNAPERASTALTRAGIILTQQQKDQITVMAEAGDVAGAQAEILDLLEERFGGSAEAGATALGRLKVAGGELAETVGGAIAPGLEVAADAIEAIPEPLQAVTVGLLGVVALAPRISSTVQAIAGLAGVGPALSSVASAVSSIGLVGGVLGPLGALGATLGAVTLAASLFNDEQERAEETAKAWTDAIEGSDEALSTMADGFLSARLEEQGLLDDLARTGVSVDLLSEALLGNQDATLAVGEAFAATGEDGQRMTRFLSEESRGFETGAAAALNFALTHGVAADDLLGLADSVGFTNFALGDLESALADGTVTAGEFVNQTGPLGALLDALPAQTDLVAGSMTGVGTAAEGAEGGLEGFGEETEDVGIEAKTASERIDALTTAVGEFFDEATREIDAAAAFRESLRDLADVGTEVSEGQLTGQERLDAYTRAISSGVGDIDALTQGMIENGDATIDVVARTQEATQALFDAAQQAGLTEDEVALLRESYGLMPEDIATTITTNASQVLLDIEAINTALLNFGGGTLDLQIDDRRTGGPKASGGPVVAGVAYPVGEGGPELFVPTTTGTILDAGRTAALATRDDLTAILATLAARGGTSEPATVVNVYGATVAGAAATARATVNRLPRLPLRPVGAHVSILPSHIGEWFDVSTAYGTLSIGGVQMVDHGAWSILDLSPLWGHPDVKGDDGVMPRASGRRPFPRRPDGVTHQLRFVCTGWRTVAGALTAYPATTPEAQLETNMAYLWDNVFEPVGSGTGTRAAVWTTPGGNTIFADVRARLPADGVGLLPRGALRAMLELEDPRSQLHL